MSDNTRIDELRLLKYRIKLGKYDDNHINMACDAIDELIIQLEQQHELTEEERNHLLDCRTMESIQSVVNILDIGGGCKQG